MAFTLKDIQLHVEQLAMKIDAPNKHLPGYGGALNDAHPYIEIDRYGDLYYIVTERGQEIKREMSLNLNDLLYKVFSDITFSMACDFEARNRLKGEDSRRQLFSKQLELLASLNIEWSQRQEKEHEWILKSAPFDDKDI